MIHRYVLTHMNLQCDKCLNHLVIPEDSIMVAHRGFPVDENNEQNLLKVAKDYNWSVTKNSHLCFDCK